MVDPQEEAERAERAALAAAEADEAAPVSPRATRDYHPPTLLAPPPSNGLPEEPRELRSVWIEPEVTVVKSRSRLSDYAPAVARARRAARARQEAPGQFHPGQSEAPWSTNSRSEPPSSAGTRGARFALIAGVLLTVAVLVLALMPKKGVIVISATGPANAAIASANVLVDGRMVCSSVPCRVESSHGSHLVRIQAPGYEQTADQAVAVRANEDALIQVNLATQNSAGIEVRTPASGLRILLDGSDRGPAPLVLRGLSPGPHRLRLEGNPAYAPYERQLQLESEQMMLLEPQLVPQKAIIHLSGGVASLGARVEIVGGGTQRDIRELPASVEVSPTETYRVRAIRAGYRDYETEVSFADGAREKSVVVDLAWDVAGAKTEGATANNALAVSGGTAEGILGANSIPISNVLIDGRPVGKTPVQIPVSPGIHSVVFVHPTMGRKSVRVGVNSGKTAVAAVRF